MTEKEEGVPILGELEYAPAVIPAQAGIHAYRDVGGRAASGIGRRGNEARGVSDCWIL